MVGVSISLTTETYVKVKELAQKEKRSISSIIEAAIIQYLNTIKQQRQKQQ
jgi:predicted transcriptional regulator